MRRGRKEVKGWGRSRSQQPAAASDREEKVCSSRRQQQLTLTQGSRRTRTANHTALRLLHLFLTTLSLCDAATIPPCDTHTNPHNCQVTYAKGWGTIKGPHEVEVALLDGGKETISAKNILIATGSEVTPLPGVPVDEER